MSFLSAYGYLESRNELDKTNEYFYQVTFSQL